MPARGPNVESEEALVHPSVKQGFHRPVYRANVGDIVVARGEPGTAWWGDVDDPLVSINSSLKSKILHQLHRPLDGTASVIRPASLGYVAADQIVRPAHDKPSPGRGTAVLMG